MEGDRLVTKRENSPIDNWPALSQLGSEAGRRTNAQNEFVFGEHLFEQSSKANIIRFLAEEQMFHGIGYVRASKLVERFGVGLRDAIVNRDAGILDLIPADTAIALFESFSDAAAGAELAMYLDALGVDKWLGSKVVKAWGQLGAKSLQANPYLLISWLDWKKVDAIGQSMGISPSDPKRLCAACEYFLYGRLNQGHTWTSVEYAGERLVAFLGQQLGAEAITACVDNHGAIYNDDGLQPFGAAVMEQYILCQARTLQVAQENLFDSVIMPKEYFSRHIRKIECQQGFGFTQMQLKAVRSALKHRFNVFAGYAGSGKTSVLRAVCELAEACGLKIHLMALSGRAAKRITEATGYPSSTIASFTRNHAGRELEEANLILIDEASMVDLPDLYRILRIGAKARVCLIGDPAQLPPIGFGAPFCDLFEYPGIQKVVLDKVHRQDEMTGIPAIAKNIRYGVLDDLERYTGVKDGVQHLQVNQNQAPEAILEIGKDFVKAGCSKDDMQIIAPVKGGEGGVNNINRFMSSLRSARELMTGSVTIRVGDPIVYLSTDQGRDLRNGSLGRLLKPDLANFEGNIVSLGADDIENIDLAYCLTVHKSQGSQWDRVIVPLFSSTRTSFVERSLIYTAITRAARQVVIVGDYDAYEQAVRSETAANQRQSGIIAHG
ncbi:AAA family ATPase [Sulfitobacter sp. 1A12157]|uniref:AAA family ATPase n=1 Tax=Sulfitobacter sp. 1A12157 TaxID=3368594 RepID=UPI0037453EBF